MDENAFPSDEAPSTSAVAVLDKPKEKTPLVHVVTHGDTLADIADKYDVDEITITRWNISQLDRDAAARGFQHSEGGRLLFPGTEVALAEPNVNPNQRYQYQAPPSVANEIKKLKALHDDGALDDEQYKAAVTKVISSQ